MSTSANALVMKEININLLRRTLKARREATKQQIAQGLQERSIENTFASFAGESGMIEIVE